jgi:hypothetical protein
MVLELAIRYSLSQSGTVGIWSSFYCSRLFHELATSQTVS